LEEVVSIPSSQKIEKDKEGTSSTYKTVPIADFSPSASPTDPSAPNIGATVSERLIPGHTLIATIFDFCVLGLITGIPPTPPELGAEGVSVLGTWPAEGRASRIRWRWRLKIAMRRARVPSGRRNDDLEDEEERESKESEGENVGTAAA